MHVLTRKNAPLLFSSFQILFLERMIPFAEYNSNRIIWEQYKTDRATAHQEHKKAVAMTAPFRELSG